METHMVTSWEDLQLDCLHIIFSKLGLDDLTAFIPFVCKSWSQASSHFSLHQTLDFSLLDLNPSSPFSKRFSLQYSLSCFSSSVFLKLCIILSNGAACELRFSPLCPPSIEVLSLASAACPRLKTLSIPPIRSDDEPLFSDLITGWRDLECLEIESKPSNLGDLLKQIGMNCKRFHRLRIRGSIDREDAAGIVDFLPRIGILDLSGSRIRKEEVLTIVDGCRELKRLSLKNCVGFEVDDELQRRASGIAAFEFEGSKVEDEIIDLTRNLEHMLMYYDDCFEMWML